MSYQNVKVAVGTYLQGFYGVEKLIANSVTYKLIMENVAYTPPSGTPYLRWGIRPADQFSPEVGGTRRRDKGLIWFQIFLPENSGETVALLIGEELSNKFFEKYIGTIKTYSANLLHVGDDGTGWVLWGVTVPYQVDTP